MALVRLFESRRTNVGNKHFLTSGERGGEDDRAAGSDPGRIEPTSEPAQQGPDWSPDGQKISFVSWRDGASQLWMMDADGREVRRLGDRTVRYSGREAIPRWSPGGQVIGFLSATEESIDLWAVDPEAGNARPIVEDVTEFDWYRDESRVIVTRLDSQGRGETLAVDVDSGEEELLLRGRSAECVVSADWRQLAFVDATSHLNQHLFVVELRENPRGLSSVVGEPRQLTDGGGLWHVHMGGFSPDGRKIVYTRDRDRGDIYAIEGYR